VRELGRGGFGVVWEARDQELGRSVAFKAVRAKSQLGVQEERLLREAEVAARLSHPNIVTLHDLGRSECGPYLVLELLRGRSLAERLEQGPIPVGEAVRVVVEVAKAAAHAHAQGVVHRDLKPGNIFLCGDGQVKVLDFGLAHAFGRRKTAGGTPAYMAPEQRRGAPEDERTDVFALGVILYRMLANELPFPDDGGKTMPGTKPAPALELPEIPALGELVLRMLQNDPVMPPRDAAEVLSVLTAATGALERTPSRASSLPGDLPSASLGELHRRLRFRALAAYVVVAAAVVAIALALSYGLGLPDWTAIAVGPRVSSASSSPWFSPGSPSAGRTRSGTRRTRPPRAHPPSRCSPSSTSAPTPTTATWAMPSARR
jgi:serine/threonine protein kinase